MKTITCFRPKAPKFKKEFPNDGTPFSGMYAANEWLRNNGFESGSTDFGAYVAITKGKYNLPQKIKNFTKEDMAHMDGVVYSLNYREGTVEIWLYESFNE